ncbi:MAG TPA: TolC family protein [Vicinamibacterales bacterium]
MRSSVARRPHRSGSLIAIATAMALASAGLSAQTGAGGGGQGVPAGSQSGPAPGTAGSTAPGVGAAQPPVVTFSPEGVGLDEAIRLTVQHDPNIQLSAATVDRLAGFAQEQSGLFDVTLFGSVEYTYRIQELTESRKEVERKKRRDLAQAIEQGGPGVERARQSLRILEQIQALPPGADQELVDQLTQLSPSLGTQIGVLNALIQSQPDQAENLRRIRADFLRTTIPNLRAGLENQVRSFERAQERLASIGEAPDDEVFWSTRANLQFSKLFRTGISVAPFFDLVTEGTNFRGKDKKEEFGGKGLNDLWTLRGGISFVLPLLRGRGAEAIAAGERAANIEQQAGSLQLEHERALSVLTTAQAYWELRAAQESLAVLERSAARYADLLKSTDALVQAGELASVEMARAQAGEARTRARIQEARRRVHEARVALATALGVATNGTDATLPTVARDPFPDAPDPAQLQPWIGTATPVEPRRDLEAALRREQAAALIERAAETDLRPRLDFSVATWYTALGEVGDVKIGEDQDLRPVYRRDTFGEVVDRWVGPSVSLTLDLEKPLGNNAARGRLMAREAERRSRQIEAVDLRRQIQLGVTRTAQSLAETVDRLRQAEAARGYYEETINAELTRFGAGESTLINTITTEQQATETELAVIAARQQVANLLAQLRFETGTLVSGNVVPVSNVVTLPSGRQP